MSESDADRQPLQSEPQELSSAEREYFTHHGLRLRQRDSRAPEAFFPAGNLPVSPGRQIAEGGLWLAVAQASWLGLPGDRDRLKNIYGPEVPYGQAAWREISDRLAKIYPGQRQEMTAMLNQARAVHDDFLSRVRKLPPHRQTYYHNISQWAAGSGHADQVMIAAARELIGAASVAELPVNKFSLRQFGIVLKAMAVHDADWSLVDSKQEMSSRPSEVFAVQKEDLAEVLAVVAQVDYDTDSASRSMQKMALQVLKDKWGDEVASLVRSIVRRSDLLQVADENYHENKLPLTTDFWLRRPDLTKTWDADDPKKEVTAKVPFYLFAKSKVYGEETDPWRYSQAFFGPGQPNPAAIGWETFQNQVKSADSDGWAAHEAALTIGKPC